MVRVPVKSTIFQQYLVVGILIRVFAIHVESVILQLQEKHPLRNMLSHFMKVFSTHSVYVNLKEHKNKTIKRNMLSQFMKVFFTLAVSVNIRHRRKETLRNMSSQFMKGFVILAADVNIHRHEQEALRNMLS